MKFEDFEACLPLTSDDVRAVVEGVLGDLEPVPIQEAKLEFEQELKAAMKAAWPKELRAVEPEFAQALNNLTLHIGPVTLHKMPVVAGVEGQACFLKDLLDLGVITQEVYQRVCGRARELDLYACKLSRIKRDMHAALSKLKVRGQLYEVAPQWYQHLPFLDEAQAQGIDDLMSPNLFWVKEKVRELEQDLKDVLG